MKQTTFSKRGGRCRQPHTSAATQQDDTTPHLQTTAGKPSSTTVTPIFPAIVPQPTTFQPTQYVERPVMFSAPPLKPLDDIRARHILSPTDEHPAGDDSCDITSGNAPSFVREYGDLNIDEIENEQD